MTPQRGIRSPEYRMRDPLSISWLILCATFRVPTGSFLKWTESCSICQLAREKRGDPLQLKFDKTFALLIGRKE